MRVVVTGANGLLGSRLCAALARQNDHVVGLGRGARAAGRDASWEFRSVELSDPAAAAHAIAEARPEAVVHAAAMTDVDGCERDPAGARASNVTATENVARAARAAGAHLVYVSTDYVFDGEAGPYREEDRPNPRGVYATTKHEGEQAAAALAPGCAIARVAAVYGWPPARRDNFGSWLYRALSRGERVRLFHDQVISPTLAENAAAMIAEVARRRLGGVWHLAGDGAVNRVEFGRLFCDAFGFDPALIEPIALADARLAAPRPRNAGLRVDKARAALAAGPDPVADAVARFKSFVQASS